MVYKSSTNTGGGGGGSGVSSINSLTGGITLTSTSNTITITPAGSTIDLETIKNNFNVVSYGAKGDGQVIANVTATSGSAVISSTSYSFVNTDVGKYITVPGAGASSGPLNANINSVSGGNATLSVNASTSIAGTGTSTFGTDNASAINSAVTAAGVSGGTIVFPNGIFVIASKIIWLTTVSMLGQGKSGTIIKWISLTDMGSGAEGAIVGIGNSDSTPFTDCTFRDFAIDCIAATMATYTYLGKCIVMTYCLRCRWENLYLHDSPATVLGVDYLRDCVITGNEIVNGGRLNNGSGHGGGGISWETGDGADTECCYITNNSVINPVRFGIANEEIDPLNTNTQRMVIMGNTVRTTLSTTSGIQDNGVTGAVIIGNVVTSTANGGYGISAGGGTNPYDTGQQGIIADNYVSGFQSGIVLDGVGAISPNGYVVRNNTITGCNYHGILVQNLSSNTTSVIDVTNNNVGLCGAAAINVNTSSGSPTFNNINISGNTCFNNGVSTGYAPLQTGIYTNSTIIGLTIQGNTCFDNGPGTQKYGIYIDTAAIITKGFICNNNLKQVVTSAYTNTGSYTGELMNNTGYNDGIGGLISAGSNVTITGSGTSASPYNIAASGSGGTTTPGGSVGQVQYNNTTFAGASGLTIDSSGNPIVSNNGAASKSPLLFTGSLFTGGTGTTTFPYRLMQPTAATAFTGWSTSGTFDGINSVSGFAGNFVHYSNNNASVYRIDSTGGVHSAGGGSFGAQISNATSGSASTSMLYYTGSLYTGGTGTTTFPLWYWDVGGTAPTTFSTAGTWQGANAASGFSGNFQDCYVNGTRVYSLSSSGALLAAGTITFSNLSSNGLIKTSGGTGALSIATSGTDYQSPITLTTTGASGAATFAGNTLNIPQYAGTTYTAGTGLTLTGSSFSVNTSQNIATLSNLTSNGLIKVTGGVGTLATATAGTDYQAPITLTTTGTSGAATFISGTLNIPNYATGGGSTVNNYINTLQIDQTPASGTYGTLAGTVNGTNAVFTVSNAAYVSGSLMVFLNGQELTQGASYDWVETTPASGTFTFNVAPPTGSIVQTAYIKTSSASLVSPIRVVTASGAITMTNADYTVVVNKTTGAATAVSLPPTPATGQMFVIKDGKGDANTNNITITPASGTIDGNATYVINTTNKPAVWLQFDGTNFWII